MKSPALFIDRDGTIIKQIDGEYISSINQIELIETIFPVAKRSGLESSLLSVSQFHGASLTQPWEFTV